MRFLQINYFCVPDVENNNKPFTKDVNQDGEIHSDEVTNNFIIYRKK